MAGICGWCSRLGLASLLLAAAGDIRPGWAATYTIIHTFKSVPGGTAPGPLVLDKAGHLWGAAQEGGTHNGGVFFELKPPVAGQTRYDFRPVFRFVPATGTEPYGPLVEVKGDFYGPTSTGGPAKGGVVYRLTHAGAITDLQSFPSSAPPPGAMAAGKAGTLYGETQFQFVGGQTGDSIFEIAPDGTFTTLYTFDPKIVVYPGLLVEKSGGLVGTAFSTVGNDPGYIFRLTPAGKLQKLYQFTGGADGDGPESPLVADAAGNLYGATQGGAVDNTGTVYRLATDGTLTTLHSFSRNGIDGSSPSAGVVVDVAGNVYGTTSTGGASNLGTVFEVAPDGTETVLHSFAGVTDGENPQNPVTIGPQGQVFGTTQFGGHNSGVAFEILP